MTRCPTAAACTPPPPLVCVCGTTGRSPCRSLCMGRTKALPYLCRSARRRAWQSLRRPSAHPRAHQSPAAPHRDRPAACGGVAGGPPRSPPP
eukprot:7049236-Prymnesium_polylepis.1